MSSIRILPLALALSLAASGCSSPEAPPADAVVTAPTVAPPVAAPADPAPAPAPEPTPALAAVPVYDPAVISFAGYRGATFGSDADAVRAAYSGSLKAEPAPASPEACHYLMPEAPGTDGKGAAFMLEGGKFVRVDIDSADVVAPGGLTTGMSDVDILLTFADAEQKPHKYTDGRYVIVKPADGSPARMVFEVDKAGNILRWRIGLEPQVHYVEGCS